MSIGARQHSSGRHIMASPNRSRMKWSTTTSPPLFPDSGSLCKLHIDPRYWEHKAEIAHKTPTANSSGNKSEKNDNNKSSSDKGKGSSQSKQNNNNKLSSGIRCQVAP